MSDPKKDVMMAVSSEQAIREAELLTLRQIADFMGVTGRQLEKLSETMTDTRERVIRVENSGLKEEVAEIKGDMKAMGTRVEVLEKDYNQRIGATKLAEAIHKFGPWLLALIAGAASLIGSGAIRVN